MKNATPTKHYSSTLHQLCKLIPSHLTAKLAQKHGVDKRAEPLLRGVKVESSFAQLTHAIGLNDVCDSLRHHGAKLERFVVRCRQVVTHYTRQQGPQQRHDGGTVLDCPQSPSIAQSEIRTVGPLRYLPRRFKRAVHAVDSTTIALVANCMDWVAPPSQGGREDASEAEPANLPSRVCHYRGSLHHDDTRALPLCAGLQAGEIAVFDKAYVTSPTSSI